MPEPRPSNPALENFLVAWAADNGYTELCWYGQKQTTIEMNRPRRAR